MGYKKKYNNGGLLGNIDMSQYQSGSQFTPTNFGNTQGSYNPWTGIDTTGASGGFDEFGRPIAVKKERLPQEASSMLLSSTYLKRKET